MKKLFLKAILIGMFLGVVGCTAEVPVKMGGNPSVEQQLGPNETALRNYINSPEYYQRILKQQREIDENREYLREQDHDYDSNRERLRSERQKEFHVK